MDMTEILVNKIFLSCLIAVLAAQLIKIAVVYLKDRKWDISLFFSTGGMPSGHSAVVSAMATAVYLDAGGVTPLFAVVLVIAVMTIYDSLTLRRAVGHHSSILNLILKALKLHRKYPVKELIGHSFTQVIAGLLLGFLVATLAYWI